MKWVSADIATKDTFAYILRMQKRDVRALLALVKQRIGMHSIETHYLEPIRDALEGLLKESPSYGHEFWIDGELDQHEEENLKALEEENEEKAAQELTAPPQELPNSLLGGALGQTDYKIIDSSRSEEAPPPVVASDITLKDEAEPAEAVSDINNDIDGEELQAALDEINAQADADRAADAPENRVEESSPAPVSLRGGAKGREKEPPAEKVVRLHKNGMHFNKIMANVYASGFKNVKAEDIREILRGAGFEIVTPKRGAPAKKNHEAGLYAHLKKAGELQPAEPEADEEESTGIEGGSDEEEVEEKPEPSKDRIAVMLERASALQATPAPAPKLPAPSEKFETWEIMAVIRTGVARPEPKEIASAIGLPVGKVEKILEAYGDRLPGLRELGADERHAAIQAIFEEVKAA